MNLERKQGVVTGGGMYKIGTKAVLTVTPNDGYRFVKWEDGNTDNPRNIFVEKGCKYVALYEKIEAPAKPVKETPKEEVAEEPVPEEEEIVIEEAETADEAATKEKPKKPAAKKKKTE